jgi:hypothetical protein
MARTLVAVQSSIPDGVSSRRMDHYTQDGTGGTFDLGDAAGIDFDATQSEIQAALDAEYTPGDYVVAGDADDFTVLYPVTVVALVADFTDLTGETESSQEQIQGGVALHASDGGMFVNNGATRVNVKNNGAGSHTVTFVTPATMRGFAVADKAFTVLPGETLTVGPFATSTFNQSSGDDRGRVYVNASGTQSEVTINPFED